MTVPPAARRLLTFGLIAAMFVFLGREIVRNLDQLRDFDWDFRPGRLAVSVVSFSAVLAWGVWVWSVLLRSLGARVPYPALARAWFVSNFGKYVPGVVWQFVSLAQLSASAGLSGSAAVTSLLVLMGFQLLSAAVVGAALLPAALAGELAGALRVARWLLPLAVALVHPAVIRMGLRTAARALRRESLVWQGRWADGVLLLLLSAISWAASGAAFYLFLTAFAPLGPATLAAVVAMNALAWIVGFAAFFAPGGLGFKEAALTLLLAGLMPASAAASMAIVARLWSIAAEVLPTLLLLALGRLSRAPASARR